ncbi:hypothetical protein JQ604_22345 [Bradyrhizobium jicamae]|nr:hypothetical protein [Bradyrhizobium jicamae]
MKRVALVVLLMTSPAFAQAPPKSASKAAANPCAPIGQTAKGELVYSMKCERLPAPPVPAPPPQAEVKETAPPPEPEPARGGIFGWSYDRR